jgi:hypothetical protein
MLSDLSWVVTPLLQRGARGDLKMTKIAANLNSINTTKKELRIK